MKEQQMKEQEQFEKWIVTRLWGSITKYDNGDYMSQDVQRAWGAWQAANKHNKDIAQKCDHTWAPAPASLGGNLCTRCGVPEKHPTPDKPAALSQPDVPEGYVLVPVEPTEEMWGELARDIIMWMQMTPAPHYGSKLHTHLTRLGKEIPDWLAKEIPNIDHTPSKGTIATCIYKAMLAAILKGGAR